MSSDNLIRLGQTESGEFSGYMAAVGSGYFLPLTSGAGITTDSELSSASGVLDAYVDAVSGTLLLLEPL